MRVRSRADLPAVYRCRLCGKDKVIDDMVLVHTEGLYVLRPRCKACHNARERGHRREWKAKYLRLWRKRNSELAESYRTKKTPEELREYYRANAARYRARHGDALAIQRRLRGRGLHIPIAEADDLLKRFGPCYPTRLGLTPAGLRECERIRARLRRIGSPLEAFEIRMMVYEDGENKDNVVAEAKSDYYIKPAEQKAPYQDAAEHLRQWHARKGTSNGKGGARTLGGTRPSRDTGILGELAMPVYAQ